MQGFMKFALQPMFALRLVPALLVASVVLPPALCVLGVDTRTCTWWQAPWSRPRWLTLITPHSAGRSQTRDSAS
jgi:hypothetical protein